MWPHIILDSQVIWLQDGVSMITREEQLNRAATAFIKLGQAWAKDDGSRDLREGFMMLSRYWQGCLDYRHQRAKQVMAITFDGDWSYEVGFVIEPDELATLGIDLMAQVSFSGAELVAFGNQLKRYAKDEAANIKLWLEILKEENLL